MQQLFGQTVEAELEMFLNSPGQQDECGIDRLAALLYKGDLDASCAYNKRRRQTQDRMVAVCRSFLRLRLFSSGWRLGAECAFRDGARLVEEGHYWIDDYLIYTRAGTADHDTALARVPVA